MQQTSPRLNYYVDCSKYGTIPHLKIPIPYNKTHNYIHNRQMFAAYYGAQFTVSHPADHGKPAAERYPVNTKDVFAKPHKRTRVPEGLLAAILMFFFLAFLVYEKDFDIELHKNIAIALLGLAFIFGLFVGDCRIRQQAQAADNFNKS